ncbi:hypothetical protein MMC06_005946 [Schaereria dolodes]|nr:hypothetical protein [Schaereria dolodes]
MAARHVFEEALLALAVLSSCVAAVTSSQVSITTPSPIPYISTQVVTTSSGSFTELSIVAPSLTQLEFLESTFTRINDIGPSSLTTQVEYIDDISTVLLFYSGTAKTGFEDIQASFTEIDKIEPSRTIVEDIEASTTAVYSDIITLIHPSATVYTDLNNSTAYDLDNEDLWTYCWYPISVSLDHKKTSS